MFLQISNNCYDIYGDGDAESIFATGWIECDRIGMCAHFTRWGTVIGIRSHAEFISSWRIVSGKKTLHFYSSTMSACVCNCQKWHHFIDWLNAHWHTHLMEKKVGDEEGEWEKWKFCGVANQNEIKVNRTKMAEGMHLSRVQNTTPNHSNYVFISAETLNR